MSKNINYKLAAKIASVHFAICSIALAAIAIIVFLSWYPDIYSKARGGLSLMIILAAVDLVCGPLLTFIVSIKSKPRRSLAIDLSLIAAIQASALGYGVWSLWTARPVFIVHEVDRFKVIGLNDLSEADMLKIPTSLSPEFFSQPKFVGLRKPKDEQERSGVMFEAALGGRDYGERPDFYIPYDTAYAMNVTQNAKSIDIFLNSYPEKIVNVVSLVGKSTDPMSAIKFLPLTNVRADYVAVLDSKGFVLGYVLGDGF